MSLIIVFIIFLLNFTMLKIYQSRVLERLLTLLIWTAIIMWYCIPGFIAALYQEETPFTPFYLYMSNTSTTTWLQDFTITFTLESLAVLCFLGVILLRAKKNRFQDRENLDLTSKYHIEYIPDRYKLLILAIFLAVQIYQLVNVGNHVDYLELNSTDLYGNGDAISQIIKPISYAMTILIAIYERKKNMLMRMAFIEIIMESIFYIMIGVRIGMVMPIIAFALRELCSNNKIEKDNVLTNTNSFDYTKRAKQRYVVRLFIIFVTLLCFLTYIFLPLSKSISDSRSEGKLDLYNIFSSTFLDKKSTNSSSDESMRKSENAEVIFIKLDAFTYGSMLTNVSGYGTGGLMPYVGSLVGFIPRFIWLDKPVAGSTGDGSIYNHPTRLVNKNVGVQSDSLNVNISPLSITLWQFGFLGFVVFVAAMLLYIRYLNTIMNNSSFLGKTLVIVCFNAPLFSNIIPSPDVILKNCITLLVMTYTVNLLRKFKKFSLIYH
jgi:hypothetical protein